MSDRGIRRAVSTTTRSARGLWNNRSSKTIYAFRQKLVVFLWVQFVYVPCFIGENNKVRWCFNFSGR